MFQRSQFLNEIEKWIEIWHPTQVFIHKSSIHSRSNLFQLYQIRHLFGSVWSGKLPDRSDPASCRTGKCCNSKFSLHGMVWVRLRLSPSTSRSHQFQGCHWGKFHSFLYLLYLFKTCFHLLVNVLDDQIHLFAWHCLCVDDGHRPSRTWIRS